MAEFEDNAVVTAEDLNNIAVDLGDTTFSTFSDEKFGVDKLNEITADIVGKGVLNIGSKCEAVLNSGTVYIQSGVIVFESGAKIRITSPVGVEASAGDYIYAFNDVTTGKASIRASAEHPTSGDYVMLAQLDSNGAIVDLRQYAVAKTTLSADVENNVVEQEVTLKISSSDSGYKREEFEIIPALPSCQVFVPAPSMISNYETDRRAVRGFVLSEDYQYVIQDYGSSNNPQIQVKKVNGLLVFELSGYRNNGFTLKFFLA